ncbi:hypothetical protein [Micromonospora coxensis]|uniref:Uncharacterized protein n=1 Tax=Micromonospora coxensis TaxID=356852 RepID=A0A1C5JAW0_9ACTN|nr:hypothetical protein [Micromonospora coxensis]SCG67700.1 hypothetical protein GA0070614_4286 [Micromonospora coxensis]
MTLVGIALLLLFLLALLVPVFARAVHRVNCDLATLAALPASVEPAPMDYASTDPSLDRLHAS